MSHEEDMIMSTTMDGTNDIVMSNHVTTIDPSVVQSRINMSASLAKEHQQLQITVDDGSDQQQQPVFPKLSAMQVGGGRVEYRRIRCPPHRYTPLRENWEQILMPLVEYLKLQASATCIV